MHPLKPVVSYATTLPLPSCSSMDFFVYELYDFQK